MDVPGLNFLESQLDRIWSIIVAAASANPVYYRANQRHQEVPKEVFGAVPM